MATTSTPATQDGAGALGDVVETMLQVRAAQQAGTLDQATLNEIGGIEPQGTSAPPPTSSEISYVVSANDLAITNRAAELAPVAPPPGGTMRGWSPEVTSRHPKLVADAMAEIMAEGGPAQTNDPIDPNDPLALAAAQRELGFAEVRKNNLRVAAQVLVATRLAAGIGAASDAHPAAQAAYAEAVEEAQATAEGATAAAPAAPPPPPPPAPKATTSSTKPSS